MESKLLKNWKYVIIILLFLGWSIGNFDRFFMNYAILDISKDLQLSTSQTGIVLSSFFAGYAIMQIPGGWLADRFGFRKIIIMAIFAWSVFTILSGVAWSFMSLILIRFLFGLGEGSFFPAASKGIASWFPQNERSRAMSFMLTSGTIMGVITPIIGTQSMQDIGWRTIFYIAGAIGIIFTLLYFFFLKDRKITAVTRIENPSKGKVSLKDVLKTPIIWNLFIAYFAIYAVQWGLMAWMPTYLVEVRHLDLTSVGYISAIPAIAGIIAMLASGYVLDKLPKGKDKVIAAIFAVLIAVFLYLMAYAPNIIMFAVYQSLVTVFMSFNIILIISAPLKMLSEEVVGTANGFINTGAQFAGVLTPMLIGFLVEAFDGSYTVAFIMLIMFALLCAGSLFLIRPKKEVPSFENLVN
ncbi:MFS transporter [Psychrobacillus lasiicapitis]|uniref:MFS transporter n=1 Tax=Psychrobacillus lasiicapitis TaxID=1636719 RepID=A0A544SWJ8_9BACI|nr:MFS transporter [Psychrobacillus lasiicapitis]TQR09589.1 MFS transporter [Psychrobacillus lasiicapitis]GGA29199.1 MFS transporter [Psychrobacillus lasiicapitis]